MEVSLVNVSIYNRRVTTQLCVAGPSGKAREESQHWRYTKCGQYWTHKSLGLLHTVSTQHRLVKVGKVEKWVTNHSKENCEKKASGNRVGSRPLLPQGLQQGPSETALTGVESGPPAKSLQVTALSGFFLRSNSYPRGGSLGSFSCSLCSSDVHCQINFSSEVATLSLARTPTVL